MANADSSVTFNLRELMQLEEERVEVARRTLVAEEQARLAASARESLCVRERSDEAVRLRAQLQAAVAERTRDQTLNSERLRQLAERNAESARQLEQLHAERGRLRTRASLALALIAALAAAGLWAAANRTAETRDASRAAARLAAAYAGELAELRSRLQAVHSPAPATAREVSPLPAATPVRTVSAPQRSHGERPRGGAVRTKPRPSKAAPDLGLDGDGSDPIEGL